MRVIAIQSTEDGVVYSYGEGEMIKNQIPDIPPFNTLKIENPCIKLDSGKYIWGFQCWWGEKEKVITKFGNNHVIVDIEEDIKPITIDERTNI